MTAREHLVNIRQLLKIEKEEDYKQYQNKILNTSVQDRKKQGVCWYPLQLENYKIGTGERMASDTKWAYGIVGTISDIGYRIE